MFSKAEKQFIAHKLEEILLSLNHPEMPTEKPKFKLHVDGKEGWSYADIEPNWTYGPTNQPGVNPFNEKAREILPKPATALDVVAEIAKLYPDKENEK